MCSVQMGEIPEFCTLNRKSRILPVKLAPGPHTILVNYGGNSSYAGSYSSTITHTVNQANTNTIVFPWPETPTYGFASQLATFYMQAYPVSPGTGTPTGYMQFIVDGVTQPEQQLNS